MIVKSPNRGTRGNKRQRSDKHPAAYGSRLAGMLNELRSIAQATKRADREARKVKQQ